MLRRENGLLSPGLLPAIEMALTLLVLLVNVSLTLVNNGELALGISRSGMHYPQFILQREIITPFAILHFINLVILRTYLHQKASPLSDFNFEQLLILIGAVPQLLGLLIAYSILTDGQQMPWSLFNYCMAAFVYGTMASQIGIASILFRLGKRAKVSLTSLLARVFYLLICAGVVYLGQPYSFSNFNDYLQLSMLLGNTMSAVAMISEFNEGSIYFSPIKTQ